MVFNQPLQSGKLLRRYKRFLADIELNNGQCLTLHCPNTGAMTGCATPGDIVWYSTSANKQRKYPHTWELTQTREDHWICVNTLQANAVVKEALIAQSLPQFSEYIKVQPEVKYGTENSRIDFKISTVDQSCFIEVKSVTLYQPNSQFAHVGYFPDTVTLRGQKHLRELMYQAQHTRTVIIFLVQHSAIQSFAPAAHIDAAYAKLLGQAQANGVEILCLKTKISAKSIEVEKELPIIDLTI